MIEFIPLKHYYAVYMYSCLAIVLFSIIHTWVLKMDDRKNIAYINVVGVLILTLFIFYIGLRPVSGRYFTDMRTYANHFNYYAAGGELLMEKDVVFHFFMKTCSSFLSINVFFLLCAFLYIFPMYKISKAFFKDYWYYCFLMFIVSFSFWSYAVNGIRNGIATSIFLWGISYQENKVKMAVLLLLSTLFHKSMLLPIFAYVISMLYNNPKFYLLCWLSAIPLSIALGGVWESLFTALGFGGDRLGGYLSSGGGQGSPGFRFDFLFYSSFAVFAGWYFIFRKKFKDNIYNLLFNTYLITNAFWILVIRAHFSNRFAYLSWFMMAIVIVYPLLKEVLFKRQHVKLGNIYFVYFSFTFFMWSIYYSDLFGS
ncbi:EpsG family protein [Seonamhaeicola sp.]|uniref:EpsG family protein n=1 Tax=Seonamhaeicola sp. TaxID=1912245 RepID=UPI00260A7A2D|nr:EpsG family protein [Seonamhaeicola sp.]